MRELDTERLDFVDNAVFALVESLAPSGVTPPEWDMQIIGEVADVIEAYYVEKGLCTERQFRDYYDDEEMEADQADGDRGS